MKMSKKQLGSPMKAPVDQVVDGDHPHDHEIANWADTIERAQDIMGDKAKMKHVQKHVAKKITSLKGLKALAGQKAVEEQEGAE